MALVEGIMPVVKSIVSASIRRNTVRGFIGSSSCDKICLELQSCLVMCAESLEGGGCLEALEAAAYILVSGVKLASHADSSSGMLIDVIEAAFELVEKCTKEIARKEKAIRDKALALILKEAKKKAFDGWEDWRYRLLEASICLCDERSAGKLEKAFDTLMECTENDYFTEYKKQKDLTVRYLLHRHLQGKDAVKTELYEHIQIRELCMIAIRDALEEENYAEAERLCLDRLRDRPEWNYRRNDPEDWDNMLFEVYRQAGNIERQAQQAKKLLLYGNEGFWDVLKQIYKKLGMWEEKYPELLEELKASGKSICYRSVLVSEGETQRLLEDVQENPYDLFYYGKFLVKDYPEEIYGLCYKVICENCAKARDRREYRKVTKQILQLVKWEGTDAAGKLIAELRQAYPRRSALLDELEKVEREKEKFRIELKVQ